MGITGMEKSGISHLFVLERASGTHNYVVQEFELKRTHPYVLCSVPVSSSTSLNNLY